MNKTGQKIVSFIARENLISHGDDILIALSGGPDSVFLFHFLINLRDKFKLTLSAFHLNHMLRGKDSDGDEKFCASLCKKYDVPFYSFRADIKSIAAGKKQSIEEAARGERYRIIDMLVLERRFTKVVTAHNSNDNAETILLNLFNGCGLHGIAGIPVKRGVIIRPLLPLSKEEILEYLKAEKIKFRIDASNFSNDYKRNYLRNKIIPLLKKEFNPRLEDALFRSGKIFEQSKNIIDTLVSELIKTETRFEEGRAFIKLEKISGSEDLFGALLRNTIQKYFAKEFTYDDYLALRELAGRQVGRMVTLSSGLTALRERGKIEIYSPGKGHEESFELRIGGKIEIDGMIIGISETKRGAEPSKNLEKSEIIEADNIDDIFILRKWKSGDKFKPLGMRGFKKVSDFLTDQKVPASGKKNQLILLNRNNIVWVCGLRIDDRVKINENSKRVIQLWIKKEKK